MTWLVDADVKEPVVVSQVEAFGGEVSVITVGGQTYRVHKYTGIPVGMIVEDGFGVTTGGEVQVLVVAGGGAGGQVPSSGDLGAVLAYGGTGGGGGGGVIECTLLVNDSTNYLVRVGDGGNFNNGRDGNGYDSYIAVIGGNDLVRAKGGGRGGNVTLTASGNAVDDGGNGASSGGGSFVYNSTNYADEESDAGDRVFGQGNNGADAIVARAGGGGGAGQPARQLGNNVSPDGGNGLAINFTGALEYYGGGGGAGSPIFAETSSGGLGGGGSYNSTGPTSGVDGTGGGGAGGAIVQSPIGLLSVSPTEGGSGIVMIRYPIEG